MRRIVAWHDGAPPAGATTVEQLIAAGDDSDLSPPTDKPRFVILTSGTTGTPKGAQRTSPDGLMTLASLIDMIPYRSGQTMVIAAPLFHSWGFLHFVVCAADRLDDGAAPPLRPGGCAGRGRAPPGRACSRRCR